MGFGLYPGIISPFFAGLSSPIRIL